MNSQGLGAQSARESLGGMNDARRRSRRPQLPSLVLSEDPAVIRTLKAVAQREEIAVDVCTDPHTAVEMVSAKRYQVLLLDFDVAGAGHLLTALERQPEKPLAMALVTSGAFLGSAFGVGALLAIHKPLAGEAARLGLKAAYSVGARIGRKSPRRSTRIPCRIGLTGSSSISGSLVNIGDEGACITAEQAVIPGTFVTIRFALPGSESALDVGAMAVWNDGIRTGLRFQRLNYRHAGRIRHWVHAAEVEPPPRAPRAARKYRR